MGFDNICCPACRHPVDLLSDQPGENRCMQCGALYGMRDGIIDFIPQDNYYWGEIDQDRMKKINDQAEKIGDWYQSICQNLMDHPSLINYIVDPTRLGWLFHCYDENNNQACLDVGSGWGMLSFGLSRFYNTVYSMDRVFERLRFQSIRAEIDGIQNIHLLRSDFLKIPIQDQTVDLVVLNGVLEWIGLSDPNQKPDILQEQFLYEIARILKSNGKIYLGIENRFSLLYFLGEKDHSGLPFTSLVPRPMANQIARISQWGKEKNNTDKKFNYKTVAQYRTYTYSLWGYKTLLSKAGLTNITPYWSWQGYSYPRMSGSLDGISIRYLCSNLVDSINDKWQRILIGLILLIPDFGLSILIKLFSPYFLIVAGRNQERGKSLQDKILGDDQYTGHFVRLTLAPQPKLRTTYLLLDHNANVAKSVRVTEQKHSIGTGIGFALQESKGIKGRLIHPNNKSDIELVAKWLMDYQLNTKSEAWTVQQLTDEIKRLVELVMLLPECEHLSPLLREYEAKYTKFADTIELSVVSEHGDFTPRNIIVVSHNELHIIDWDFAKEKGNPLMDIGGFYLSLIRRAPKRSAFSKQSNMNGPINWYVNKLSKRILVPFSIAPSYYLLRVIERILEQNDDSPITKRTLADLILLFGIAIEYSLSMND
jgi:ubiquinone/menaquinone biosynthesis C-methylase UbiE/uncharacterized protein YbaR (Trm112 family)